MRLLFAVVLALLVGTASEAQTDAAKALVGKWEGELQQRGVGGGDPNRTLIIQSVGEKDGKWVAAGRYGVTGKGLGSVQIDVDTSSKWPSIRFVTGANSTVRLNLLDEKSMAGTITLTGTSQAGNDRSMKMGKVE